MAHSKGFESVLREFCREVLFCTGRVAARHQLPDDAVWQLVQGIDVLYGRARRRLGLADTRGGPLPEAYAVKPHPGIAYLLKKLEREEA